MFHGHDGLMCFDEYVYVQPVCKMNNNKVVSYYIVSYRIVSYCIVS